VQGDERDVVFISVGYGRDQHGAVSMNFGPLNREGGERRLNVLISRARRRCEVFTNLRSDDIDLGRTDARGVAAFKRYLQYADTGVLEMDEATGREPDSPFEVAVASALRELEHRVEYQIGVGGFRIDLAVVDPERPGRYLLGIECDGATYHSARTARDRDRIRQSVLEGLGWRIHRVWSTDWFRDPRRELERVAASIERAKAEPVDRPPPRRTVEMPSLERHDEPVEERAPVPTEPYVRANLRGHTEPLHEVPRQVLARDVEYIVRIESPVHFEEVARRILDASGVSRLGSRIRKVIEGAARIAAQQNPIEWRGDFLYRSGQERADVPVRDRSGLPSGSRKFEFIAPEEVQAAIAEVISSSFGIAAEDLALEVCRMLGFGQTSEQMRVAVAGALADMESAGTVAERHGMLALTNLNATDYRAQL
jgi:very-short-patch-repair endonuclease